LFSSTAWSGPRTTAATVPTVIGLLSYRRDFEREADAYALRLLAANGLDARPLDAFFRTIERLEVDRVDVVPGFLSSHPSTEERRRRLEAATPTAFQ
jgi:predicted Zn-dependent protease